MNVNVLQDGQGNSALFLFVNKLAFTTVIAHIQIPAHVNEVGLEAIVRYLFVHRIVTMEYVSHRTSVSVINGRMNGEMVELEADSHCLRSPMVIRN